MAVSGGVQSIQRQVRPLGERQVVAGARLRSSDTVIRWSSRLYHYDALSFETSSGLTTEIGANHVKRCGNACVLRGDAGLAARGEPRDLRHKNCQNNGRRPLNGRPSSF